jgi:acyl-CoA dehydrogenase
VDLLLNPEDLAFRAEVRSFLADHVTPGMRRAIDLTTGFLIDPDVLRELHRALHRKGWSVPHWPLEHGGTGWSPVKRYIFDLECGSAGAAAYNASGSHFVGPVIIRYGTPPQQEKYLPGIRSGDDYWAQGYSEPGSGSDLASLKTRAVRDGDHYIINGQKVWTSRAEHSDLMLLLARTTPREQAKSRTGGLSVFLVDMRLAQGANIRINTIRTMMNHATTEIFFDDLRVPEENLIGEEGEGLRYILSGMNVERILIAAECIGDAKWFIGKATAYAKERAVFGRPIGQNQGVQFPIARAYAQMRAAELMVRDAANRFQAGHDCGAEANMAKLLAADASWAAAEMCVQTHGGFGFAEEFDIERKFRETRLYQVAPISTNLILSYLAEHVLGLPRSY